MNNHRINNLQRKVFANLATETLDQKIEDARDEAGELVAAITSQVKRELGVETLDNEIKALESQVETLKAQRESMGFPRYANNPIAPGSQAKKLIDSRTSAASERIVALKEKRTEVIARIWASTTLDEAMALLNEVRAL